MTGSPVPTSDEAATRSAWRVGELDCPSEEALVRQRLAEVSDVRWVRVVIPDRLVVVAHDGPVDEVDAALDSLSLGATALHGEEEAAVLDGPVGSPPDAASRHHERRALRLALGFNLVGLLAEVGVGIAVGSAAVVADGLDMGADVAVYAMALTVVGAAAARQRLVARTVGVLMALLAVGGFVEVVRRAVVGVPAPEPAGMALVTVLALLLNIATMRVLAGARHAGEHTRSAWVMTSSDVQANLVVLAAAGLVALTDLAVPDLVVGALVLAVLARGSWRILRSTWPSH